MPAPVENVPLRLALARLRELRSACSDADAAIASGALDFDSAHALVVSAFDALMPQTAARSHHAITLTSWFAFSDVVGGVIDTLVAAADGYETQTQRPGPLARVFHDLCTQADLPTDLEGPPPAVLNPEFYESASRPPAVGGTSASIAIPGLRSAPDET